MSITVYITWVNQGIEDDTETHDFEDQDEYEEFYEMHWRGTNTVDPWMFERMTHEERLAVQALWEEIEE